MHLCISQARTGPSFPRVLVQGSEGSRVGAQPSSCLSTAQLQDVVPAHQNLPNGESS